MTSSLTLAVGAALAAAAAAVSAQPVKPHVSQAAAERTAMKWVGGGTLRSENTGSEAGQPIYTFYINVAKVPFVEKVNVSARTGQVIGCTYAGPQKK